MSKVTSRLQVTLPKAIADDTNVLAYRFDPHFPAKQRIAEETLRRGIAAV